MSKYLLKEDTVSSGCHALERNLTCGHNFKIRTHFFYAKAKRQLHMFTVAKAKRQLQLQQGEIVLIYFTLTGLIFDLPWL